MIYLPDVIDQMLAVIPETETDFISELVKNKDSAKYSSPETTRLRWEVTG